METDFIAAKLQMMHSWIAVRQRGSKLLGHCSICEGHKNLPGAPTAWNRAWEIELHDSTRYTDYGWAKTKDKARNHCRSTFHKAIARSIEE